ncbi:hypothetical protein F7725_001197 [Dissostichus mawsoni]|uniref:Uncharacterized protein n=1 Tax=Dissostichus mawsoni TaxID=36200 RepID=A0A7J5ZGJ0_DISMA|nr:hypothetical protein F7725_001197 [Dissostichus mawsoni]
MWCINCASDKTPAILHNKLLYCSVQPPTRSDSECSVLQALFEDLDASMRSRVIPHEVLSALQTEPQIFVKPTGRNGLVGVFVFLSSSALPLRR